ncbi:hypothetical protein P0O24_10680 [Methanotrichaceae archaeon M04Ac]|uniref:Uncharacterized protein n=1 Tax=Candidatus Methanocrinis alkalitolerans TaxID=3033395 RepID=A0ABT5XH56_9EURY|nr:hypothetical protein [Candidatus Methanocrinis alkalitolerans]
MRDRDRFPKYRRSQRREVRKTDEMMPPSFAVRKNADHVFLSAIFLL